MDNLIKYKCLSCNKDYSNKLDEKFKNKFKNINLNLSFLIMISIYLFYCQKKVFILMSIWMTGKSLVKRNYLRKKNFRVT